MKYILGLVDSAYDSGRRPEVIDVDGLTNIYDDANSFIIASYSLDELLDYLCHKIREEVQEKAIILTEASDADIEESPFNIEIEEK